MKINRRLFIYSLLSFSSIGIFKLYSDSTKRFISKKECMKKILELLNYEKVKILKINPIKNINQKINDDFNEGNIVNIDGWIFSESEIINSI